MGAGTTDDPKRAPSPYVPVGKLIDDDLEISEFLGFGGMAQVFRARQRSLDRDVAVKILRPSRNRERDRFLREARSLGRLKHPVTVVAHRAGTFEHEGKDLWYIVMELVDGETLKSRIARGAVPLEQSLGIVRDVAETLREAHRLGVVHRDLKPSNIMLQDDDGPKTRVLDSVWRSFSAVTTRSRPTAKFSVLLAICRPSSLTATRSTSAPTSIASDW